MAPESLVFDGGYNSYESIEQWDCPYCFKTLSPSRPPIFNPDNCSCVEAGTFTSGENEMIQQLHCQQQADPAVPHRAQSWVSESDVSVSCPEGPEREDPNINISNTYLPLGPDRGLNEAQHRRSASFHSDMSYQMRRFLVDGEMCPPISTDAAPSETKFLPQDLHIQSQRAKKEKKRSKPSSQDISSGGDGSFHSWGGDPTAAVGTQFESDHKCFEKGYPLTLSGMSGYHSAE